MLAIRRRPLGPSPVVHRHDIVVAQETHPMIMAHIQQRPTHDMRQRFADGHRAYVAWRNGEAAAWGWDRDRNASQTHQKPPAYSVQLERQLTVTETQDKCTDFAVQSLPSDPAF